MIRKKIGTLLFFILIAVNFNMFSVPCELAAHMNNNIAPLSSFHCETELLIAQKDSSHTSDQKNSGTKTSGSPGGSQGDKKQNQSGSKPLKTFVPTEKIKVDTVVDFPIDI